MNREIVGLRCEIVGLVIVLIATIWQGTFTDWFEGKQRGRESFFVTVRAENLIRLSGFLDA